MGGFWRLLVSKISKDRAALHIKVTPYRGIGPQSSASYCCNGIIFYNVIMRSNITTEVTKNTSSLVKVKISIGIKNPCITAKHLFQHRWVSL